MAMLQLSRVLVPVDFSPDSDRAIVDAIELARAAEAEIDLLHVWRLPVQTSMPAAGLVPLEATQAMRDSDQERLDAKVAEVRGRGVKCAGHLVDGVPSQEIVDAVGRFGTNLIVMGTRGHTGLKHVLLGSVAERVARNAECPVLTVKADERAGGIQPRVVVVPMDFSPAAREALTLAEQIATAMGPSQIVLVHGYYVPVELEQLIVAEQGGTGGLLDLLSEESARDLQAILEDLQEAGVAVEYVAEHGPPERVVAHVAEQRRADLIVMGTHGRTGLSRVLMGSVAEHVVRTAPCPVLTVRPPKGD